jgi:hypothetical protein
LEHLQGKYSLIYLKVSTSHAERESFDNSIALLVLSLGSLPDDEGFSRSRFISHQENLEKPAEMIREPPKSGSTSNAESQISGDGKY